MLSSDFNASDSPDVMAASWSDFKSSLEIVTPSFKAQLRIHLHPRLNSGCALVVSDVAPDGPRNKEMPPSITRSCKIPDDNDGEQKQKRSCRQPCLPKLAQCVDGSPRIDMMAFLTNAECSRRLLGSQHTGCARRRPEVQPWGSVSHAAERVPVECAIGVWLALVRHGQALPGAVFWNSTAAESPRAWATACSPDGIVLRVVFERLRQRDMQFRSNEKTSASAGWMRP